jgi:dissimilatory sulfite reductase (desulfoviridin) alpha/beta subunit
MENNAELIKQRYGNPFDVLKAVERAASSGFESLSEDDLFMCKWLGLYTHRHEPGYFMLRTKQPNGFVTPEQLDVIADIAQTKNKGYADITTRQDFQLHWVRAPQAAEILRQLSAAGISTQGACGDVLRNVVGCPVSGVDQDELIDAGPMAPSPSRSATSFSGTRRMPICLGSTKSASRAVPAGARCRRSSAWRSSPPPARWTASPRSASTCASAAGSRPSRS